MAGYFRSLFAVFALAIFSISLSAQRDSLHLVRSYSVSAQHVYVDALENVYIHDAAQRLRKLERDGQVRFWFQDLKLGTLGTVDLSDPLNIMLYYPEFQEIVLLDRTLNEVSRVNLTAFGFYSIEAVGYASDNRIWLYDPMGGTLKKIDSEGRLMAESQILPPLIGRQIHPLRIREQEQRVYVQCEEAGILIFDAFGKYIERLDWPREMDFQVVSGRFFGCLGNACRIVNGFSRREQTLRLSDQRGTALEVRLRGGRLYALYADKLLVFDAEAGTP